MAKHLLVYSVVNSPHIVDSSMSAIVLAAGKGTRMQSELPKVLHPLVDKPMILHIMDALEELGFGQEPSASLPILVIGHGGDAVQGAVGTRAVFVRQEPQLGTGHAALMGLSMVPKDVKSVLLIHGDEPLISVETYRLMLDRQTETEAVIVLLTGQVSDTHGLGRVIRGTSGQVNALVQEGELSPAQRETREINFGAYVFDRKFLEASLPLLNRHSGGEYYLTDLIEVAVQGDLQVETVGLPYPDEQMGVNDREQLVRAERFLRQEV